MLAAPFRMHHNAAITHCHWLTQLPSSISYRKILICKNSLILMIDYSTNVCGVGVYILRPSYLNDN